MYFPVGLHLTFLRSVSFTGLLTGFVFCSGLLTATETEQLPGHGIAEPSSIRIAAVDSHSVSPLPEKKTFDPKESEYYPLMLVEKITALASGSDSPQLTLWAKSIIDCFGETVRSIEQEEPHTFVLCLQQLKRSAVELTALRTSKETGIPSGLVLEEIRLALERRILLWETAVRAKLSSALPVSRHFSKELSDVRRLKERTRDAEAFFHQHSANGKEPNFASLWCEYLDTQSFLTELEACEKSIGSPNRRVSANVSVIPLPELTAFCDRANVILSRLDNTRLTEVQKNYLNSPQISAWKEELQSWAADTVSVSRVLAGIERYEATGGMSDMAALFRLATRLSFSYTVTYRQLGTLTLDLYSDSNVKFYISKVLLNHLLPAKEQEVARFRETIQGQPVVGQRHTDSEVTIHFIPDSQRLLMSLDISGNIRTSSRASAFATTLFNRGQAQYEARKKVELTGEGFLLSPCEVKIPKNRMELLNVKTNFDRVPLLSNVVRGVVLNQYEERQGDAKAETQQKMLRQIRARVDKEAEEPFRDFNKKFQQFSQISQERFGFVFEPKNSVTLNDWLLTSWAVRGQDTLGGNTPCPETPSGSFADMKIHESVLNLIVGKLEFEGKKATVGDFRREIAQKFNRAELMTPGENDDVEIAFAEENPVIVRFTQGRIDITINVQSLRLASQTHRDFTVNVRYIPITKEDGSLVLERDRYISLVNVQRRSQIPLRAAFGVIFPAGKTFPLTIKLFETDPRFAALTTGHCRIQNGWFAVALIAK